MVTAHVDHVIGIGIFVVFQVSTLDQDVVDLLLGSFRIFVCRLFSQRLSTYRVECCEILHHQPMLQPFSNFVSSIERVRANTSTLNTVSWPQFGVEVSSNNLYTLFAGTRVLLNCSARVFDVVVGMPGVLKIYAHLLDTLMVDHIVVVMARSLMFSVSMIFCRHFLFSRIPTPCSLSSKTASICNLRDRTSFPRFFHLGALISCFL